MGLFCDLLNQSGREPMTEYAANGKPNPSVFQWMIAVILRCSGFWEINEHADHLSPAMLVCRARRSNSARE